MHIHLARKSRSVLLLALSIFGIIASASVGVPRAFATQFPSSGSPQTVPMGTTLLFDSNIRYFDAAPAVGTALASDPKIKFLNTTSSSHWNSGGTVAYDSNNDGKYDFGDPVIGGPAPVVGQPLSPDPKLKFVDTNLNGVWDPGETVVYEKSGLNTYALGDPVIGATPPVVGGGLALDSRVKYVDSGSLNHWVSGDSVIYDSNSTGIYLNNTDRHLKYVDTNSLGHWTAGDTVVYDTSLSGTYATGDLVLNGTTPTIGTPLKFDKLIKFIDSNGNGHWVQGDGVVYDSNNDNIYESGEPVIVKSGPLIGTALSTDPKVSYVDTGAGHWVPGNTVIYDTIGKGYFNASIDIHVLYYNSTGKSHWVSGETVIFDPDADGVFNHIKDRVINGTLIPPDGTLLSFDSHMRIVDTDMNGVWDPGEPVVYDNDGGNVYDLSDTVIYPGNPGSLTLGVSLTEPVLFGTPPPIGTPLKVDPKTRYVETNGNKVWDPGEAIIYDNDSSTVFDAADTVIIGASPVSGSILHDPVIAGPTPTVGTQLKADSRIKIVSSTGLWIPGESVVYDANANNIYDAGEQVIAGGAAPDGVWDQGETIIYDTDSSTNNATATSDALINGTLPLPGIIVRGDPHIKFVDASSVGHWVAGDTVVYDAYNNNVYEPGDIILEGSSPATLNVLGPSTALDPSGRIWLSWNEKPYGSTRGTQVFFKMWNGTAWSNKQQVTTDPSNVVDSSNFLLALPNQTMMIIWSSNKTGRPDLYYRFYNSAAKNPSPTSNPVQLTNSIYSDRTPSATVDRYGRIWVAWARQNTTQTGCLLICTNIYYKYFNGTSWSSDFPLPPASNPSLSEITPSISRTKDGRVWIFWATAISGTYSLYYSNTDGTVQTLPTTGVPSSSWSSNATLVSEGTDIDEPFMTQSRDGTLWVFYQSNDPTLPNQYIHYMNSTNGLTWVGPTALTTASNDGSPSVIQMTDHRIWIFWERSSNLSQIDYTTSSQITGVYDLGIQTVAPSSRLVRSGWSVLINVTVTNYGDFGETGLLTLSLNSTLIESTNQTFAAGSTYILTYNYTSKVSFWGRYNLSANLKPAVPESTGNAGDNSWSAGLLRISPPGDIDGDGYVDIIDAAQIAIAYGKPVSQFPYCDVDRDGTTGSVIDILDAATLAIFYGDSV